MRTADGHTPGTALTTNGIGLERRAAELAAGRTGSGQHLAGLPGPGAIRPHRTAQSARRRAGRYRRRRRSRSVAGEDQRRSATRLLPRGRPATAGLLPAPRARAAVHRVHADRCSRLGHGQDGERRRHPGGAAIGGVHARRE
jgi:hypothetical protein